MTRTYLKCLQQAENKTGLCPRGYCTAKHIFNVYPSAYANGYAASVCQGKKPDFLKNTYAEKIQKKTQSGKDLKRWFNEKWVNVCKPGNSAGGYAPCGSREAKRYPYCRPYYKLPGTPVLSVNELTRKQRKHMCDIKKGPKRVYVKDLKKGIKF